jgi:hypothetical protein
VRRRLIAALFFLWVCQAAYAQVFSPRVLKVGQVDTFDLESLARSICDGAGAVTPRAKAEAIWRFFLTDGRFVTPGFWYHIAGWAYEEPQGEVLDPMKLLHSYGFGLCYHIAPLLEAVFEAAGFDDARVWFLTGHTVAEVWYEGAYHYFDSDMMGYNPVGQGEPRQCPVASVAQLARDPGIMLDKLNSPTTVKSSSVDQPWYPADLKEAAIGGLASLFTTTQDNWLFPHTRYPRGHRMDFVLRPGERLIRFYQPENGRSFYLPFRHDGKAWREFPQESPRYGIRTEDGPRSQKDDRRWSTGRIEYRPVLSDWRAYYPIPPTSSAANLKLPGRGERELTRLRRDRQSQVAFEIHSPYVLIDATLSLRATLRDQRQELLATLSVDQGRTWVVMGRVRGPYNEVWSAEAPAVVRSEHGALSSVGGRYGYLVRLTLTGPGSVEDIRIGEILLSSRFQVNPRTLPELGPGRNELVFQPGSPLRRRPVPVQSGDLLAFVGWAQGMKVVREEGQTILWPAGSGKARITLELTSPDGADLAGFEAGARFLDLRDGLAPDKLTAETRPTKLAAGSAPEATLAWSTELDGDYRLLWRYRTEPVWRDGERVAQVLRWPEVDRRVLDLPPGTKKVYVRYAVKEMGLDSPRIALLAKGTRQPSNLEVTHEWFEDGRRHQHVERIANPSARHSYTVHARGTAVTNHAIILACTAVE